MTKSELKAKTRAVKEAQQTAASSLDDDTALDAKEIYSRWSPKVVYKVGDRVRDGDGLYKRRQPQTAPEIYRPNETPALWERIAREAGTKTNPINYAIGMELVEDKYYRETDTLYRCIRSSGVPIYNLLADLIDIYVTIEN